VPLQSREIPRQRFPSQILSNSPLLKLVTPLLVYEPYSSPLLTATSTRKGDCNVELLRLTCAPIRSEIGADERRFFRTSRLRHLSLDQMTRRDLLESSVLGHHAFVCRALPAGPFVREQSVRSMVKSSCFIGCP